MVDRLSALDASFLYMESATTPMHVGGVAIFQEPDGAPFDHEVLLRLIGERIVLTPRFRQRIRSVPGRLAGPVWVDDAEFDPEYHVRRSGLPRPGTDAQLRDLVARIMSRPLDRRRPLWEMYLIEGLQDNRFAILTKTHHAMVDGLGAVDIGQVLLDASPEPRATQPDAWQPEPAPSQVTLVADAVCDVVGRLVRSPSRIAQQTREVIEDVGAAAAELARHGAGVLAAALSVARAAPPGPLNGGIGEARRFATARASVADLRAVRRAHGGTVNDVLLAVVAGALRTFLLSRGEPLDDRTTVRALVPVSVRTPGDSTPGNQIAPVVCELPVGEADPVIRLQRVRREMDTAKASGQLLGARSIIGLAGFAPPTLHLLGSRAASELSRRVYNVLVTNVPGPQFPLYAAGARMLAAYPVAPLAKGQALAVGVTSYDGGVFFGLNADREAMPDLDLIAVMLTDALAELVALSPQP
ncbi:MAG: wax ester/triacylglycerol synthase family O-acyltransferase [Actinomycetota bacterium]|nr:MAG: wax ester/triacylglycerol synthase family O-acyltransferase [Actinomycetota bacterium]